MANEFIIRKGFISRAESKILSNNPVLRLTTPATNNSTSGILEFLEHDTIWGTDAYGFRFRHDGDANIFYFESANQTVINSIYSVERDSARISFNKVPQSFQDPDSSAALTRKSWVDAQIANLNTAGTLTNVAYKNQANIFSSQQEIKASDQINSRLYIENTGTNGKRWAIIAGVHNQTQEGFSIYNNEDNVYAMTIENNGRIAINRARSSSTDYRLDVNGTTFSSRLFANGAITGQSGSSAHLQVNGFQRTGNIYLSSGGNTPDNLVWSIISQDGVGVNINTRLTAAAFVGDGSGLTALPTHNHDDIYYTKTQSDSRFYNVGEKVGDSDKLDGRQGTDFVWTSNSPYTGDPDTLFEQSVYRFDPNENLPTNNHYVVWTGGNAGNVNAQIAIDYSTKRAYYRHAPAATYTDWTRFFDDEYHPNADKWTTGRNFTINLTGEVTGSNTQSVDGSATETWTIATTIGANVVGANELNVSGNGTSGYVLTSDGDGSFSWTAKTTNTDTNNYVSSASFNTGDGILTLNRSGLSAVTVDLDGRYLTSYSETDTLQSVTSRGAETSVAMRTTSTMRANGYRGGGHGSTIMNSWGTEGVYLGNNGGTAIGAGEWNNVLINNASSGEEYVNVGAESGLRIYSNSGSNVADWATKHTTIINANTFTYGGQNVFHDAYHPNADKWTTARTLTIGNTGKSVNGSVNVSWSLAEIGALGATAKAADSDKLDGVDSRYYTRGDRKTYSSKTHTSGSDGWYTIYTVEDTTNTPALFMVRAYAHTAASFMVSEGYSTGGQTITVLNAAVSSTNVGYSYLKGVRILGDGKVQIKLNDGATTAIDIQVISNGETTSLVSSLVQDTTASPDVNDVVDPLVSGSMRAQNNMYVDTNRVFHDGYHPNADTWTTARNFTITLTGDVTGTDTESVNGSTDETWSIGATLADAGIGAGTYGSTSDGTKIDEITVDSKGRITAISTGNTGTGNGTLTNSDYPAIVNANLAGTPTLSTGITAAEIRTLIGAGTGNGSMSSFIIKEGNGSETSTVTNGETITFAQGTGMEVELTSTSSGGTLTFTNTSPNVNQNVVAGDGLTGGGTGSTTTLNVGAGIGILVNADQVYVDAQRVFYSGIGTANGDLNLPLDNRQIGQTSARPASANAPTATHGAAITYAGLGASAKAQWYYTDDNKWYVRTRNYNDTTTTSWQRMFADNYHPNADKWTTARTLTVTLTGDVTGTANTSIDGSANKTITISTSGGGAPSNMVTTDTAQNISGNKTFASSDGITLADPALATIERWYIEPNLTDQRLDFKFKSVFDSIITAGAITEQGRWLGNGSLLTDIGWSALSDKLTGVVNLGSGSTEVLDWDSGNLFYKSLTSNTTFSFSNHEIGESIVLRIDENGTNYSITFSEDIYGDSLSDFNPAMENVIIITCIDTDTFIGTLMTFG